MKNFSIVMVIYLVFFLGSLLCGFQTITSGNAFKGALWMVAALCWASCVRNEFRKGKRDEIVRGKKSKK